MANVPDALGRVRERELTHLPRLYKRNLYEAYHHIAKLPILIKNPMKQSVIAVLALVAVGVLLYSWQPGQD